MVVVYHPIYRLEKDTQHREEAELFVGTAGSGALFSLTTDKFRVESEDGKAKVNLTRVLTKAQCRELAQALLGSADRQDAEDKYNRTIHFITPDMCDNGDKA